MSPIILGVDPSFNRSGWAALDANAGDARLVGCGVIVPKGNDRALRLFSISEQFETVLQSWCPAEVFLERPGAWQRKGGTRRETIEVLAMGRAAMLLACVRHVIPVMQVDVHVVRQAILGRVNAPGRAVVDTVRARQFEVPERPRGGPDEDIANAILTAIYGIECSRSARG